jgi:hypothetical protein
VILTVVAAVLAVALGFWLRRADRGLVALAAFAVGVPVAMALVGLDYLITRNLIAAMVPLVALAGVAAARSPAGPALVGALCAVGVIAYAGVEANPYYQRDDWRAAAAALGQATRGPRVIVVNPSDGVPALDVYLPVHKLANGLGETTREIDVIDLQHDPPAVGTPFDVAGFTLCAPPVQTREYDVVRYCAPTPTSVQYVVLERTRLLGPHEAAILRNG